MYSFFLIHNCNVFRKEAKNNPQKMVGWMDETDHSSCCFSNTHKNGPPHLTHKEYYPPHTPIQQQPTRSNGSIFEVCVQTEMRSSVHPHVMISLSCICVTLYNVNREKCQMSLLIMRRINFLPVFNAFSIQYSESTLFRTLLVMIYWCHDIYQWLRSNYWYLRIGADWFCS